MPLYEYQCDACGHRFETIQKYSDPLVEQCPKCGAAAVHKLQSAPAFQFKGSGWYITDYAKKDAGAADGGGKGTGAGEKNAEKTSEKNAERNSEKSAEKSSASEAKKDTPKDGPKTETKAAPATPASDK